MSAQPVSTLEAPVAAPAARGRAASARRPILALVPPPARARRAPFVILVLGLLGLGLLALLLLNTAAAQDAFRLHRLQNQKDALDQQRQALQQQVATLTNPGRLAAAATGMGLVDGGPPTYLTPGQPLPKGLVMVGNGLAFVPNAHPAAAAPAPAPTPSPSPSPTDPSGASVVDVPRPGDSQPAAPAPAAPPAPAPTHAATAPATGTANPPTSPTQRQTTPVGGRR